MFQTQDQESEVGFAVALAELEGKGREKRYIVIRNYELISSVS